MNTISKTIAILVVALLCFSCDNKSNSGDNILSDSIAKQTPSKTWDDYQRTKDSLWTIYNESTDENEVERAKEMLYCMACNAEKGTLAYTEYERYKARIEAEFLQLDTLWPNFMNLFIKEKEKWVRYHEAVYGVVALEDNGSIGGLYILGVLKQSVDLWLASFHNLLMFAQCQEVAFPDSTFTSRMIDDAYSAFLKQEDENWLNAFSVNEKDGMVEHHKAIELEWQLWNEWMGCRKKVSKALPKDLRKIYDGCTNLTMRTKLFQLKNKDAAWDVFCNSVCLDEVAAEKAIEKLNG